MARYQSEFLRELARLDLVPDLTVFLPEEPNVSLVPEVPGWRYVRVRARPMLLWEQVGMPRAARRAGVECVISTTERPPLFGPPVAVYIYEHPRHRSARQRATGASARQRLVNGLTLALFHIAVPRAAVVLAASESTRRDLRLARALVVPSAASEEFRPDESGAARARDAFDAPHGYLLHLSSDDPRDNTEVVLDAYAELVARSDPPPLVICGPVGAELASFSQRARNLGIDSRVRWVGFLGSAELIDAYRGALAYVDPSLYEGFGLQALEALSCGTPAVASNTTSLPEVIGEGGILLDPYDVVGFATALERILADEALRADLSRRALAQAARFSWERTVRETLIACARGLARA